MKTTSFKSWPCTIARTVEVIGDSWTWLVLRDSFYGETRFDAFVSRLGIARSTLADRLRTLVAAGLLERRQYQSDPVRHEYVLTECGRDFFAVMAVMKTWADKWLDHGEEPPVVLSHDRCGHDLLAEVVCAHCGDPVQLAGTHAHAGAGFPERLLRDPAIAARFGPRAEQVSHGR